MRERTDTVGMPWGWLMALALIVVAATTAEAADDRTDALGARDREELLGYARDTWRSVAEMAEGTPLPVDGLRHLPNGKWQLSPKTTPTDIGVYLWSVLAAERLGIIDAAEAHRRLKRTLGGLERGQRVHSFYFDTIDPRTGEGLKKSPYTDEPITGILSSVDNAWLATGLTVVRNAYPALRERADGLLQPMNFGFFYVPFAPVDSRHHPGLIRGPYFVKSGTFGGFHQLINTEQRIITYLAIARGQAPAEHYYRIERTLKIGEMKQSQEPQGVWRSYLGVQVFEGHYTYRDARIVPSWGGSMFEALMPTLFVPEEAWAPRGWGVNHRLYVRAHIEHGLEVAGYGYWGFSPACDPAGGYRTYGVEGLGSDPTGYTSHDVDPHVPAGRRPRGPSSNGVVTPHASFLALRFAPSEAMANLRKLREHFPVYGDHGFLDSVNVSRGVVADRVLMLDQGMILAVIANALVDDAMRRAFVDESTERILRPMMAPEEFTAGPVPAEAHPPGGGAGPFGAKAGR